MQDKLKTPVLTMKHEVTFLHKSSTHILTHAVSVRIGVLYISVLKSTHQLVTSWRGKVDLSMNAVVTPKATAAPKSSTCLPVNPLLPMKEVFLN